MKLTKNTVYFTILACIILAATSIYSGFSRLIARDEGYFLYAARMIQVGALPYRDFFFPQTPLTPILFSAWFDLVGTGWYQARLFSALMTSLCGVILYVLANRLYSSGAALVSLLIYSVSAGVLIWLPTAQTDCISVALLLAAMLALRACESPFLAGALFGLCVSSRLTIAPMIFVFILEICRGQTLKEAALKGWRFLFGMLVPTLSILSIAILDIENFFEHNLQYHFDRTTLNETQLAANRWRVLAALLGLRNGIGLGGYQFQILLYCSLVGSLIGVWHYLQKHPSRNAANDIKQPLNRVDPFLAGAVVLFLAHLVPEPTYLQYFSLVEIMLIPPTAHYFVKLSSLIRHKNERSLTYFATFFLLTAYAALGAPDMRRFLYTGEEVIGVGKINRNAWTIETVRAVSNRIDMVSDDDETILTSWPGYCLETSSFITPGLESNFGPQWARNALFSTVEQKRRKILTWERAVARFTDNRAKTAVLFLGIGRTNNLEKEITKIGGTKVSSLSGIAIYRKPK